MTSEEAALSALLTQHPDAFVNAVNAHGLFVALPASVPINGHRQLAGKSALDSVVPADRAVVISAWERVRQQRGSQAKVSLAGEPPLSGLLHFFDVQDVHRVTLCVFVPDLDGAARDAAEVAALTAHQPRFCRIRKNEVAIFVGMDDAAERMLGFARHELLGRRSLDFIHPDDHDIAIDSWMAMLAGPGPGRRCRMRHLRADGSYLWVEVTNLNRLADPEHGDVLADVIDISEEMATHEALRDSEQLLRRLAESLPLGVFQIDSDSHIVYTNARLHDLVGTGAAATLAEQLPTDDVDDRARLQDAVRSVLGGGPDQDFELALTRPDLDPPVRRCLVSLRGLTSEAGTPAGAVGCVSDITESARLRRELEDRATYDFLTGCHNRASILAALGDSCRRAGPDAGTAVIFIDIDRFKRVNDELGHAAGDELLVAVASRLRGCVREDRVGRLGGDEFLVICDGVPDRVRAGSIGTRIAHALHGQVRVGGLAVPMRASIGVAWSDDPALGADALLARADAAMYASKRADQGAPVVSEG